MNFESLSLENYIFLGALVLFIIQLIYFLALYSQLIRNRKASIKGKTSYDESYPPLSIIISADDATEKLAKQLPLLLEQDYPQYEVIVINDSTDSSEDESTDELLENLKTQYNHLYFSFTPKTARYISRKKLSLTLGVKASHYEWIVFTEPGYCPTSNQWLKNMARNFTLSTDIVLGYGNFKEVNNWKNKKMIYDSSFDAIRYLSLAISKKPYKGYGKNLAYRKELFYQLKGYSSHLNLLRGEDDLFINQTVSSTNTRVELSPESILTYNFKDQNHYWKNEKQNYILSSFFYKGKQKYALGFETFTRVFFYITIVGGISWSIYIQNFIGSGLFAGLWFLRFFTQSYIINKSIHILGYKRNYILSLPILDFWHPLFNSKFKTKLLFKGKRDYMRKGNK